VDDGSTSRAARLLDETHISPAVDFDQLKINGIHGQRGVAQESAPVGWLPGGCSEQAPVAGNFNFRRMVHRHFNRASSVPAPSSDGGPAGHWIRVGRPGEGG
jgi:hypothetical protein